MFLVLKLVISFPVAIAFVDCQDWQKISTQKDIQYQYINADINTTIVSSEFAVTSLLQCSYKCYRRSSVSFYYKAMEHMCYCNNATDPDIDGGDSSKTKIVYGVFRSEEVFKYQNFKKWLIVPEGFDCYHYFLSGYTTDGIYMIKPKEGLRFEVWCDMLNGGWTVFQNRYDGSVNFNRGWTNYRNGFGTLIGEFWLGLDSLHYSAKVPCEVWIEMTAPDGKTPKYAYLKLFNLTVGGSTTDFTLSYDTVDYNCSIYWPYTHLMKGARFSTPNSTGAGFCANHYKSGWWFSSCHEINLNGIYGLNEYAQGLLFSPCWGDHISLVKSAMKLRRSTDTEGCKHLSVKGLNRPFFITSCYLLCIC